MNNQITLACNYNWWRGEPIPDLPPLRGGQAKIVEDVPFLADLHHLDVQDIQMRFEESNYCYVAFLDDTLAGYGWVGTKTGRLHEFNLSWPLSENDRLLWDFVTLPEFRGRGVYPYLLQTILRAESVTGERFWIGHRGDNIASQRGILKAGFNNHYNTVLTSDGKIEQVPNGDLERAMADSMVPAAQKMMEQLPPQAIEQIRKDFSNRTE